MPVVEAAIDRVVMRARGLYGLGIGTVPVEGQDLWATFGKDFTQGYIQNQEEVTIYQTKLRSWVIGQNTGPGVSGMNQNPQNVPWNLFQDKLVGFADVASIENFISISATDYSSRMEIEKNCQAAINSMRTNQRPGWAHCCFEPIFAALRFRVTHAQATSLVKVWTEPDVWVVVYDLEMSNEQKVTAYLRDDTFLLAPEYAQAIPPVAEDNTSIRLVGAAAGAEITTAPVDESTSDYLGELFDGTPSVLQEKVYDKIKWHTVDSDEDKREEPKEVLNRWYKSVEAMDKRGFLGESGEEMLKLLKEAAEAGTGGEDISLSSDDLTPKGRKWADKALKNGV